MLIVICISSNAKCLLNFSFFFFFMTFRDSLIFVLIDAIIIFSKFVASLIFSLWCLD